MRRYLRYLGLLLGLIIAVWLGALAAREDAAKRPLFRFVQLSDMHITLAENRKPMGPRRIDIAAEILQAAMDFIGKQVRPDWIVATGDIVENGGSPTGEQDLQKAKEILASAKVPVFAIFGNHDGKLERFVRIFGAQDFIFECRGVRCVMLNSGVSTAERDAKNYAVLDRLLKEKPRMPTLLFQHFQVYTGVPLIQKHDPDSKPLLDLIDANPQVSACFSGHLHIRWIVIRNNVTFVTAPALCQPPHAFIVYDAYPREIRARMYATSATAPVEAWVWEEKPELAFVIPLGHEAKPGRRTGNFRRTPIPFAS